MTLGTMLGGFMLGPVSNNFGRRQGLWAAFGLTCISAIIQMATTNKGALYFARLLIGMLCEPAWFIKFNMPIQVGPLLGRMVSHSCTSGRSLLLTSEALWLACIRVCFFAAPSPAPVSTKARQRCPVEPRTRSHSECSSSFLCCSQLLCTFFPKVLAG